MSVMPYIECGKVINTHGCHGGLKLESWCNTPEELAALKQVYFRSGEIYSAYKIIKASIFKQFVVATLEGISDMDIAMACKGKILYAKREDFQLAEDEYFIADLFGLSVLDAKDGQVLGTLVDVINRGASDLYVVRTEKGDRMIPAVPEFIDHVDIQKGVFVTPIEGMLD